VPGTRHDPAPVTLLMDLCAFLQEHCRSWGADQRRGGGSRRGWRRTPFVSSLVPSQTLSPRVSWARDTAHEVGEATLGVAGGTAVVKFVVVWKRIGGQWRLQRDIWNSKAA